jgi:hypothetical protein
MYRPQAISELPNTSMPDERMQCNAAGRVVLELKMPWLDGATPQAMSRLQFTRRLEALVQRPRPQ